MDGCHKSGPRAQVHISDVHWLLPNLRRRLLIGPLPLAKNPAPIFGGDLRARDGGGRPAEGFEGERGAGPEVLQRGHGVATEDGGAGDRRVLPLRVSQPQTAAGHRSDQHVACSLDLPLPCLPRSRVPCFASFTFFHTFNLFFIHV